MILADNGAAWFITGVPDERWDNDVLRNLSPQGFALLASSFSSALN